MLAPSLKLLGGGGGPAPRPSPPLPTPMNRRGGCIKKLVGVYYLRAPDHTYFKVHLFVSNISELSMCKEVTSLNF